MRDIVVEGCDGTGKTNLVNRLVKHLGLPIHPRACTSEGGPVPNLDEWVEKELLRAHEPGIYDRHPLISEPIYGPIIRGSLKGKFNDPAWLIGNRKALADKVIVVWCDPGWSAVQHNLAMTESNQMAGVTRHSYGIYHAYLRSRKAWPGLSWTYDYTRDYQTPEAFQLFVSTIRSMMREA